LGHGNAGSHLGRYRRNLRRRLDRCRFGYRPAQYRPSGNLSDRDGFHAAAATVVGEFYYLYDNQDGAVQRVFDYFDNGSRTVACELPAAAFDNT